MTVRERRPSVLELNETASRLELVVADRTILESGSISSRDEAEPIYAVSRDPGLALTADTPWGDVGAGSCRAPSFSL